MQLFHGSPQTIDEIREGGTFGGVFASASAVSARSHGAIVHIIESPRPLSDFALNYEIEGAFDVALQLAGGDERIAEAIMSKGCEELEDCAAEDAGEQGWEFQRLRGLLAKSLGFTSIEMLDEHGTTWLCLPGCSIRAAD